MKHGFIMLAGAIGADLGYDITCPCILLCGEHNKTGATKHYNPMWAAGEHLPLTWVKDAAHNSNADNPGLCERRNREVCSLAAGVKDRTARETDTMKIEQQAQTRAFLIQSFGSVRVGRYTALRSRLL